MVTISSRVRTILAEAIHHVSSGGSMQFDPRSLYYAVRELYLKRWPNKPFFKYPSFSQTFLRRHEKEYGSILGLVRGPRGAYVVPDEEGTPYEYTVRPGLIPRQGIANKILLVEKEGLYDMMRANEFERRLDCAIMTTKGYTSEAGRDILMEAETWGIPICVLHDYDVNGVLIFETLGRPTTYLDSYVMSENLVDVGINWEIVQKLMETRGLTPEPVGLGSRDRQKLQGMVERGDIGFDEYEFLQNYRVELNALTPEELLKWLEQRLEALNLWKTVPTPEELERAIRENIVQLLTNDIWQSITSELGFEQIQARLLQVSEAIKHKIRVELNEQEFPCDLSLDEFVEQLRQNILLYWTKLAQEIVQTNLVEDIDVDSVTEEIETLFSKLGEDLEKIQGILDDMEAN